MFDFGFHHGPRPEGCHHRRPGPPCSFGPPRHGPWDHHHCNDFVSPRGHFGPGPRGSLDFSPWGGNGPWGGKGPWGGRGPWNGHGPWEGRGPWSPPGSGHHHEHRPHFEPRGFPWPFGFGFGQRDSRDEGRKRGDCERCRKEKECEKCRKEDCERCRREDCDRCRREDCNRCRREGDCKQFREEFGRRDGNVFFRGIIIEGSERPKSV